MADSLEGSTVFEIGTTIGKIDLQKSGGRSRGTARSGSIVSSLIPKEFPMQEGLFTVTPQQLASLKVPAVAVRDGQITGFQRGREQVSVSHVRKIARALIAGDEVPPILVSMDPERKEVYLDDGQHRSLGSIAAGKPIEAVVKVRTLERSRKLFANQSKAKRLKHDNTLLVGTSALERYIQDAVTNSSHAWHPLVGRGAASAGGGNYITLTTMAVVVGGYVHNVLNAGVNYHIERPAHEFSTSLADEMAGLLLAFGTRKTNPMAYKAMAVRAISQASVYVMRRGPKWSGQVPRWGRHMPTFQFGQHLHLLNLNDLTHQLVIHWNKGLQVSSGHKVSIVNYR